MTTRQSCFYCDKPVFDGETERDHAPIPKRHGGTETVATCIPCHDLKDRLSFNQWDAELMARGFAECGPIGRIFFAKAAAVALDLARAKVERESVNTT